MTRVLYENDVLKLVESLDIYFLVADGERMRVVFDENCKIDRVCVKK